MRGKLYLGIVGKRFPEGSVVTGERFGLQLVLISKKITTAFNAFITNYKLLHIGLTQTL